MESGESILAAALREKEEETGLTIGHIFHKPEWLVRKPSNDPEDRDRGKLHQQHVFICVTFSLEGLRASAVDGTKVLTNEMFSAEQVSRAVFNGDLLGHYELLKAHSLVLRKALLTPNLGIP